MPAEVEEVRLRIGRAGCAHAVAEPVVTAVGARAGLTVAALDELVAALALVLRAAVPPVTVEVSRTGVGVAVAVEPVPEPRIGARRALLDGLSPTVQTVDSRVILRADA